MRTRFFRITLSLFGFLFVLHSGTTNAPGEETKRAADLVREALRAEADGDLPLRATLIEKAKSAEPSDEASRWQSGMIRTGNTWRSYDQVVESWEKSKAWEQYLKRRSQSEPTLESQVELAKTCHRINLLEQEKAHWRAVLQLDPSHAEAQKRLGVVLHEGQWLNVDQQKQLRDRGKHVAMILRKESSELKAIEHGVRDLSLNVNDAAERLLQNKDVDRIPAWERFLSTPSDTGALVTIAALRQMTDSEASLSLLRHALYGNSAAVRKLALESLRNRDEYSYLPSLIHSLRGHWVTEMRSTYNSQTGMLVFRYSTFADSEDRQTLSTLDDVFFLTGFEATAVEQASNAAAAQRAEREAVRQIENAGIDRHNNQLIAILSDLMKEPTLTTPQQWWQWWDDRNEVFSSGEKPLSSSYAFTSTLVYGERPPPQLSSSSTSSSPVPPSPFSSSTTTSRIIKKDCLAGGTKILTNRGSIAVDRIRMGDLVLARHPKTGETAMKPVLQVTSRPPEPLYNISFGTYSVRASGGHPFWVSGKGWVRARELETGMIVHGLSEPASITNLQLEERPARTFNLVVDDFHSYFVEVGSVRILSHDNTIRESVNTIVPGLKAN